MGIVLKVILAFGIGIGAMAGLQYLWLSSVKQQLRTQHATLPKTEMKPLPKFGAVDMKKFHAAMYPKVDWKECLARHHQPADQPEHQCRPHGAAAAALPRHAALLTAPRDAGTPAHCGRPRLISEPPLPTLPPADRRNDGRDAILRGA
jgi:hypothetical protein